MDIVKQVGDKEYSFQRMKTMDSLVFHATLAKLSGPGLMGVNQRNFWDSDGTEVLAAAISHADPQKVALFIRDTIRKMVVVPAAVGPNGNDDTFDKYYYGKDLELMQAFYACILVQGGDVIELIKKKLLRTGTGTKDSSEAEDLT